MEFPPAIERSQSDFINKPFDRRVCDSFIGERLGDGACGFRNSLRQSPDHSGKRPCIETMLGGKLFQLPEADFTKFVGASDFHGERGAPQIHLFRVAPRSWLVAFGVRVNKSININASCLPLVRLRPGTKRNAKLPERL